MPGAVLALSESKKVRRGSCTGVVRKTDVAAAATTAAAAAAPSAWLRVASDDPDLAFHEIFRYGDDDDQVPGSACRDPKDMKDSKRLLVLTCIEGGQHKQPPLFKRRDSTAYNLAC